MEELKKLKRSRAGVRSGVTRHVRKAKEILESYDSTNEGELEAICSWLLGRMDDLKTTDERILELMSADETVEEGLIAEEVDSASDVILSVNEVLFGINKLLRSKVDGEGGGGDEVSTFSSSRLRVKLPKIELEKFSGDPKKWISWWDSFDSVIHKNDLSNVDKFNYLRSLLMGDALSAIAGLSPSNENYKNAIEILTERFGKKVVVISSHMDAILKIPVLTEGDSTKKIRRVYDKIEMHIRSLQSLGVKSENYGMLLAPVILNHLPEELRLIVSRKFDASGDVWELDELLKILKEEIEARERSGFVSSEKKMSTESEYERGKVTAAALMTRDTWNNAHVNTHKQGLGNYNKDWGGGSKSCKDSCAYCKGKHSAASCKFVSEVGARRQHLRKTAKCFNCLLSGHMVRKCRLSQRCRNCGGKHHVSICINPSDPNKEIPPRMSEVSSKDSQTEGTHNMFCNAATSVLMLTARGQVSNVSDSGKGAYIRIIFDNCSTKSYITDDVRNALGLPSIGKKSLNVTRFMDCDNPALTHEADVVQLRVKGVNADDVIVTAYSVPSICPPPLAKPVRFYKNEFSHLAGLDLADEIVGNAFRGDGIDMMIGLDFYYSFLFDDTIRGVTGPVATKSRLGWLIAGPIYTPEWVDSPGDNTTISMLSMSDQLEDTDKLVQLLWSLEGMGIREEDDSDVMLRFCESTWFNELTGRYQVSLPWRSGMGMLADNYEQSYRRLLNQLKKFKGNPKLYDHYNSVMAEQIEKGVLEVVPIESPSSGEAYYVPHHAVIREDHSTTKVRVVYDASSKSVGPSLNQCLYEGPSLLPELIRILMKFRCRKIAVVGDIEKAFLQIEVAEADRNYLRLLWVTDFDPRIQDTSFNLVALRSTRCLFGVTSSPFHLQATLKFHTDKYRDRHPNIVDEFQSSTYVDDFDSGSDTVAEGYELFKTIRNILKEGGFNLRKFSTNSDELYDLVKQAGFEQSCSSESSKDSTYAESTQTSIESPQGDSEQKILGIVWNKKEDYFAFRFDTFLQTAFGTPLTKRGLLKLIARIYDPLGLICPLLVSLKCAFRVACELGIGWDDKLSDEHIRLVRSWLENLKGVGSIEYPRYCINFDCSKVTYAQLVGFSDASMSAFGIAIYLRVESEGVIDSTLVFAKSRVAPKGQTLPRKELLGALQLARGIDMIRKVIGSVVEISEEYLFSDSKTVLCWIRNKHERFKQFVEERSKSIRERTNPENWLHVKGKENPADLTTRDMFPSQLKNNQFWSKGPIWLVKPIAEWPSTEKVVGHTDESIKELRESDRKLVETSQVMFAMVLVEVIDSNRFSSWKKLVRVTAYVKRYLYNLRNKKGLREGELNVHEVKEAEMYWIKYLQCKLQTLGKYTQLERQFQIFRDEEDILRAKGRLDYANLDYDRKFPIVLPPDDHVIELMIWDAHETVMHSGVNDTMVFLRQKFCIPRLRQVIRRIVRRCVICRMIEGKAYSQQKIPPLPSFRVIIDEPFTVTGADYAGPLFVKTIDIERKNEKAYILLLTCASTRAVHLELVHDLSGQSCVRALRRFIARKGAPDMIFSDNAKTFKAEETRKFLRDRGIKWEFNLPRAPWTGGVFERMIRSTKRCLKKVIGKSSLSFEELETVLVEVENVLNNRPLTYVDNDVTEEVITPNRLICGRNLSVVSLKGEGTDTSPNVSLKRRFLYRQKVLRDFRCRWEKEYLSNLRESQRIPKTKLLRTPCVGDVVLVHGDTPRLCWRLGRVMSLIPSKDGIVRGVSVRLSGTGNVVNRSVKCLYPLEVAADDETLTDKTSSVSNISQSGGHSEHGENHREPNVDKRDQSSTPSEDDHNCDEELQAVPVNARSRPRRAAAIDSDIKRQYFNQK